MPDTNIKRSNHFMSTEVQEFRDAVKRLKQNIKARIWNSLNDHLREKLRNLISESERIVDEFHWDCDDQAEWTKNLVRLDAFTKLITWTDKSLKGEACTDEETRTIIRQEMRRESILDSNTLRVTSGFLFIAAGLAVTFYFGCLGLLIIGIAGVNAELLFLGVASLICGLGSLASSFYSGTQLINAEKSHVGREVRKLDNFFSLKVPFDDTLSASDLHEDGVDGILELR